MKAAEVDSLLRFGAVSVRLPVSGCQAVRLPNRAPLQHSDRVRGAITGWENARVGRGAPAAPPGCPAPQPALQGEPFQRDEVRLAVGGVLGDLVQERVDGDPRADRQGGLVDPFAG